ncbi:MAG: hypothetical protein WC378_13860, partial [Opitutaceae bacterium]
MKPIPSRIIYFLALFLFVATTGLPYSQSVSNWGFYSATPKVGDSLHLYPLGAKFPPVSYNYNNRNPTTIAYRIRKGDGTDVGLSSNGYMTGGSSGGAPGQVGAVGDWTFDVSGTWTIELWNIQVTSISSSYPADIQASTTIYVAPNTYTVTTGTAGTGSGTVTGAGTYIVGNSATLTATPDGNSDYTSWSDSGSQTHTVSAGGNYIATFTKKAQPQNVSISDPGTLTLDNTGHARVTYTASGGHVSYTWGGQAAGFTGNPVQVDYTSTGSKSVTVSDPGNANWLPATCTQTTTVNPCPTYTVTTSISGSGSGSVSGSGTYLVGNSATISASEGTGSYFAGWSDSGAKSHSVSSGGTYTATFNLNSYSVSLGTAGSGSGSVSGGGSYAYNSTANLSASANTGSHFTSWSDGGSQSHNITVTGNYSATARFDINTYTVTATASGSGTVSGGGTYNYGSTATLSATPGSGYIFSSWSDGGAQTHNRTVTDNISATATFSPKSSQSAVTISPASQTITTGQAIAFTSSGGSGTGVYSWGGDASGSGSSKSVTFGTSGTRTVTVYRQGDGSYLDSNTASATITVTSVTTAINSLVPLVSSYTVNDASSPANGRTYKRSWQDGSTWKAYLGRSGVQFKATGPGANAVQSFELQAREPGSATWTTIATGSPSGVPNGSGVVVEQ